MLGRHSWSYAVALGEVDPALLVDDAFLPLQVAVGQGRGDWTAVGDMLRVTGAEVSTGCGESKARSRSTSSTRPRTRYTSTSGTAADGWSICGANRRPPSTAGSSSGRGASPRSGCADPRQQRLATLISALPQRRRVTGHTASPAPRIPRATQGVRRANGPRTRPRPSTSGSDGQRRSRRPTPADISRSSSTDRSRAPTADARNDRAATTSSRSSSTATSKDSAAADPAHARRRPMPGAPRPRRGGAALRRAHRMRAGPAPSRARSATRCARGRSPRQACRRSGAPAAIALPWREAARRAPPTPRATAALASGTGAPGLRAPRAVRHVPELTPSRRHLRRGRHARATLLRSRRGAPRPAPPPGEGSGRRPRRRERHPGPRLPAGGEQRRPKGRVPPSRTRTATGWGESFSTSTIASPSGSTIA